MQRRAKLRATGCLRDDSRLDCASVGRASRAALLARRGNTRRAKHKAAGRLRDNLVRRAMSGHVPAAAPLAALTSELTIFLASLPPRFDVTVSDATIMLGSGTGSEQRQPLGLTIVGGLIVSQMLTLFTTPVIYLQFDKLARRFDRSGPPSGTA